MNILITGTHGFVGSNLVSSLKNKHNIYGLDVVAPDKEGVEKTFTWDELNILPQVDVIIHLAGKAHDIKNKTNAQVYFDINTGLTKKIYDWFLTSESIKFIFFSSVKAAADKVEGVLIEDVIPSPKGPYGKSKIAAENYILSKDSRTKNSESIFENQEAMEPSLLLPTIDYKLKRTYILRPCMIHGQGNKGNFILLYNMIKKGIPYPLGAFENQRSYTSVDNLCFIINQLIDKDIPSGIYNVSDDESLSTNELISLMYSIMGKPNRIWKWNKSLVQLATNIGTLLHLPFNNERLQRLTENYVVSNDKLKKALKIDKMPFRAEEGFRKTMKSIKN